jgi:serine/threonine protein phosphatase 1
MQTLVIGDIHGCYDELQNLLDQAGIGDDDQIVAVGDIVDRGPDTPAVLDFFRTTPNSISVRGNHERKHIKSYHGLSASAPSQRISRHQIGAAAYPQAIIYMKSMPTFLRLDEALVVHAFFAPGVPVDEQREEVIVGTMSGERYVRDACSWPWYEHYDGEKPLIVGHRDYSEDHAEPVVYQDRVYMLDTSCCKGGALTGLLLPSFRLISVPSRADHWTVVQRQYAHLMDTENS